MSEQPRFEACPCFSFSEDPDIGPNCCLCGDGLALHPDGGQCRAQHPFDQEYDPSLTQKILRMVARHEAQRDQDT